MRLPKRGFPCRRSRLAGATILAFAVAAVGFWRGLAADETFQLHAQHRGASLRGRRRSPVPRPVLREELFAQTAGAASSLEPISAADVRLNFVVFIAGCVPFLYAAYEFWRRIAFGQQFGTGDDPVVFERPSDAKAAGEPTMAASVDDPAATDVKKQRAIGKKDAVTIGMDADTNRGRRVLGADALGFAYILMFLAAASVAVTAVVVYPVFTGQVAMT